MIAAALKMKDRPHSTVTSSRGPLHMVVKRDRGRPELLSRKLTNNGSGSNHETVPSLDSCAKSSSTLKTTSLETAPLKMETASSLSPTFPKIVLEKVVSPQLQTTAISDTAVATSPAHASTPRMSVVVRRGGGETPKLLSAKKTKDGASLRHTTVTSLDSSMRNSSPLETTPLKTTLHKMTPHTAETADSLSPAFPRIVLGKVASPQLQSKENTDRAAITSPSGDLTPRMSLSINFTPVQNKTAVVSVKNSSLVNLKTTPLETTPITTETADSLSLMFPSIVLDKVVSPQLQTVLNTDGAIITSPSCDLTPHVSLSVDLTHNKTAVVSLDKLTPGMYTTSSCELPAKTVATMAMIALPELSPGGLSPEPTKVKTTGEKVVVALPKSTPNVSSEKSLKTTKSKKAVVSLPKLSPEIVLLADVTRTRRTVAKNAYLEMVASIFSSSRCPGQSRSTSSRSSSCSKTSSLASSQAASDNESGELLSKNRTHKKVNAVTSAHMSDIATSGKAARRKKGTVHASSRRTSDINRTAATRTETATKHKVVDTTSEAASHSSSPAQHPPRGTKRKQSDVTPLPSKQRSSGRRRPQPAHAHCPCAGPLQPMSLRGPFVTGASPVSHLETDAKATAPGAQTNEKGENSSGSNTVPPPQKKMKVNDVASPNSSKASDTKTKHTDSNNANINVQALTCESQPSNKSKKKGSSKTSLAMTSVTGIDNLATDGDAVMNINHFCSKSLKTVVSSKLTTSKAGKVSAILSKGSSKNGATPSVGIAKKNSQTLSKKQPVKAQAKSGTNKPSAAAGKPSARGKKKTTVDDAAEVVNNDEFDERPQLRALNMTIAQEMARLREELLRLNKKNINLRTEYQLLMGQPQPDVMAQGILAPHPAPSLPCPVNVVPAGHLHSGQTISGDFNLNSSLHHHHGQLAHAPVTDAPMCEFPATHSRIWPNGNAASTEPNNTTASSGARSTTRSHSGSAVRSHSGSAVRSHSGSAVCSHSDSAIPTNLHADPYIQQSDNVFELQSGFPAPGQMQSVVGGNEQFVQGGCVGSQSYPMGEDIQLIAVSVTESGNQKPLFPGFGNLIVAGLHTTIFPPKVLTPQSCQQFQSVPQGPQSALSNPGQQLATWSSAIVQQQPSTLSHPVCDTESTWVYRNQASTSDADDNVSGGWMSDGSDGSDGNNDFQDTLHSAVMSVLESKDGESPPENEGNQSSPASPGTLTVPSTPQTAAQETLQGQLSTGTGTDTVSQVFKTSPKTPEKTVTPSNDQQWTTVTPSNDQQWTKHMWTDSTPRSRRSDRQRSPNAEHGTLSDSVAAHPCTVTLPRLDIASSSRNRPAGETSQPNNLMSPVSTKSSTVGQSKTAQPLRSCYVKLRKVECSLIKAPLSSVTSGVSGSGKDVAAVVQDGRTTECSTVKGGKHLRQRSSRSTVTSYAEATDDEGACSSGDEFDISDNPNEEFSDSAPEGHATPVGSVRKESVDSSKERKRKRNMRQDRPDSSLAGNVGRKRRKASGDNGSLSDCKSGGKHQRNSKSEGLSADSQCSKPTKIIYCPFCQKSLSCKVHRHIKALHKNEKEVKTILAVKDPVKRELLWLRLRHIGNYIHNNRVMREGQGELVVKVRGRECEAGFMYCTFCFSYVRRHQLFRHLAYCSLIPKTIRTNRSNIVDCSTLLAASKCLLLSEDGASKPQMLLNAQKAIRPTSATIDPHTAVHGPTADDVSPMGLAQWECSKSNGKQQSLESEGQSSKLQTQDPQGHEGELQVQGSTEHTGKTQASNRQEASGEPPSPGCEDSTISHPLFDSLKYSKPIESDQLILTFGNILLQMAPKDEKNRSTTVARQKYRALGNLLRRLREATGKPDFVLEDFMTLDQCHIIVDVAAMMTDVWLKRYVLSALSQCCTVLQVELIGRKDFTREREIMEFKRRLTELWRDFRNGDQDTSETDVGTDKEEVGKSAAGSARKTRRVKRAGQKQRQGKGNAAANGDLNTDHMTGSVSSDSAPGCGDSEPAPTVIDADRVTSSSDVNNAAVVDSRDLDTGKSGIASTTCTTRHVHLSTACSTSGNSDDTGSSNTSASQCNQDAAATGKDRDPVSGDDPPTGSAGKDLGSVPVLTDGDSVGFDDSADDDNEADDDLGGTIDKILSDIVERDDLDPAACSTVSASGVPAPVVMDGHPVTDPAVSNDDPADNHKRTNGSPAMINPLVHAVTGTVNKGITGDLVTECGDPADFVTGVSDADPATVDLHLVSFNANTYPAVNNDFNTNQKTSELTQDSTKTGGRDGNLRSSESTSKKMEQDGRRLNDEADAPLMHSCAEETGQGGKTLEKRKKKAKKMKDGAGLAGIVIKDLDDRKSRYNWCMFCGKCNVKITRHFTMRHADEDAVILWQQEKDPEEWTKHITWLRNVGNFMHNVGVLRAKEGDFFVKVKRNVKEDSVFEYEPCSSCFVFCCKEQMYRHRDNCYFTPLNRNPLSDEIFLREYTALLGVERKKNSEEHVQSVLGLALSIVTHGEEISDRLILALAKTDVELSKSKDRKVIASAIRVVMKLLSSLLMQLRHVTGDYESCLEDYIHPEKLDVFINAAEAVATAYPEYLFLKIFHKWTRDMVMILGLEAFDAGDVERESRVRAFLTLFNQQWPQVYEDIQGLCPKARKIKSRSQPVLNAPLNGDRAEGIDEGTEVEMQGDRGVEGGQVEETQKKMPDPTDTGREGGVTGHSETSKGLITASHRKHANSSSSLHKKENAARSTCLTLKRKGSNKFFRKTWSSEERNAVFRNLGNFIENGTIPGKSDIASCIAKEPILKNRFWKNVKDFCRNVMTSYKIPSVKKNSWPADQKLKTDLSLISERKKRKTSTASKMAAKISDTETCKVYLSDSQSESVQLRSRNKRRASTAAKTVPKVSDCEEGEEHLSEYDSASSYNPESDAESLSSDSDLDPSVRRLPTENVVSSSGQRHKTSKLAEKSRSRKSDVSRATHKQWPSSHQLWKDPHCPSAKRPKTPKHPTTSLLRDTLKRSATSLVNETQKRSETSIAEKTADDSEANSAAHPEPSTSTQSDPDISDTEHVHSFTPKQIHIEWSEEEQKAVFKHLGKFLMLGTLPVKADITYCIAKEWHVLSKRSWRNVKYFCRNALKRKNLDFSQFVSA